MAPMKKQPKESFQRLAGAISLGAAARRAGLPRREVKRMIQRGKLPFMQVRGQICVPTDAVKKLCRGQRSTDKKSTAEQQG